MDYDKAIAYVCNTLKFEDLELGSIRQLGWVVEELRRAKLEEVRQNDNQQAKVATCRWTETEECWESQCGQSFVFIADGPTENKMVFCPYCGGKLTTVG